MIIKKEDHNTGVSDGIKKFLMGNLIKNLKNGALLRNLIKSIKKYFIKSLKRRCLIMSKKAPFQKKKKLYQETKKCLIIKL